MGESAILHVNVAISVVGRDVEIVRFLLQDVVVHVKDLKRVNEITMA